MIEVETNSRLAKRAVALARELQTRAGELQTGAERRQLAELDGMLQRPADKVTVTQLTDQAFRPESARRGIDQFLHMSLDMLIVEVHLKVFIFCKNFKPSIDNFLIIF